MCQSNITYVNSLGPDPRSWKIHSSFITSFYRFSMIRTKGSHCQCTIITTQRNWTNQRIYSLISLMSHSSLSIGNLSQCDWFLRLPPCSGYHLTKRIVKKFPKKTHTSTYFIWTQKVRTHRFQILLASSSPLLRHNKSRDFLKYILT